MQPLQTVPMNDAHDDRDTGKPPCDFCRRTVPCECHLIPAHLYVGTQEQFDAECMCSCGRCCDR